MRSLLVLAERADGAQPLEVEGHLRVRKREAPEVKLQARAEAHRIELVEIGEHDLASAFDVVGVAGDDGDERNEPAEVGGSVARGVAEQVPQLGPPPATETISGNAGTQVVHVVEQERVVAEHARALPAIGFAGRHSLIAPAVRPLMNDRIEMKKAISNGSEASA